MADPFAARRQLAGIHEHYCRRDGVTGPGQRRGSSGLMLRLSPHENVERGLTFVRHTVRVLRRAGRARLKAAAQEVVRLLDQLGARVTRPARIRRRNAARQTGRKDASSDLGS